MRAITSNEEARELLANGVRKLANAVGSTLGPHGKTVTVWLGHGVPLTTKDGATVAREVKLSDQVEAAGAELAKAAAKKCAEEAGDGTTTATVLVDSFVDEGMEAMRNGMTLREIRSEYEDGIGIATRLLEDMKKEVTSEEDVVHVATISANDAALGKIIGEALFRVGANGLSSVELGLDHGVSVRETKGYALEHGWMYPTFVEDISKLRTTLDDVAIYLSPDVISSGERLVQIFEEAASKNKKSLALIIGGLEGQALHTAILNHKEKRLRLLPIKAPAYGERRTEILGDIAAFTGGSVHVEGEEIVLGHAQTLEADRMGASIIGGSGEAPIREERLASIKTLKKSTKSEYDRQELQKRLEALEGRAVTFTVGGHSETEALELFHRVEDAVLASKAAMRSGILPGGGRALLEVHKEMLAGYPVFAMSLVAPFWRLMSNADPVGFASFNLADALTESAWQGLAWTGKTREWKILDLYKEGIIDPFQVTIGALRNASAAAILILGSDTVITESQSK